MSLVMTPSHRPGSLRPSVGPLTGGRSSLVAGRAGRMLQRSPVC